MLRCNRAKWDDSKACKNLFRPFAVEITTLEVWPQQVYNLINFAREFWCKHNELWPCADIPVGSSLGYVDKDLSSDPRPRILRGDIQGYPHDNLNVSHCLAAISFIILVLLLMNIVRLYYLSFDFVYINSSEWCVDSSLHTNFDLPQPSWNPSKHGRHRQ